VGDYPFTTKIPSLGVIRRYDEDVVLADIPGIIEGASAGAGLGLQFLKHVSRTVLIAFIIDCSQDDVRETYHILEEELVSYDPALAQRDRIVVASKMDLVDDRENLAELSEVSGAEAIPVSIYDRKAVDNVAEIFFQAVMDRRSTA
jgi:GTP-binding protein